jgi:hypothetical protein
MIRTFPIVVVAALANASFAMAADESVLLHPIYGETYSCIEHAANQLPELGDALGTDCTIERLITEGGRTWARAHQGSGRSNGDWYGYGMPVLSPCACSVVRTSVNPVLNEPGVMGKPPASMIVLRRDDGVLVLLAHVDSIQVAPGAAVVAGQPIARVGNNGVSRAPHIHIGAWRGNTPLQIRFDQAALGKLLSQ